MPRAMARAGLPRRRDRVRICDGIHPRRAGQWRRGFARELAVRAATVLDGRHRVSRGRSAALALWRGGHDALQQRDFGRYLQERAVLPCGYRLVGVIFEFGVVGALLVAAVYGTGLVVTMRAGAGGDCFLQSLSSYVLFMIVTSAIYSVVFTPGELAVVVAMSEYLARYAPRVPRPRAVSGFVALSPHETR